MDFNANWSQQINKDKPDSSHASNLLIFQTRILLVRKELRAGAHLFTKFGTGGKLTINGERNEFNEPNQPNVIKDAYDGLDRWNPLMLEESSVGERGNHTNRN